MANNFHKRHYERLAEAMQEASRRIEIGGHERKAMLLAVQIVIEELSDVLAGDNGQFKRDRFVRACVPGNNVRARS